MFLRYPKSALQAKTGYKHVYALVDPRNNLRRYVGSTNNGNLRMMCHMSLSKSSKSPLYQWIRRLFMDGYWPIFEILETVREIDALRKEMEWINRLNSQSLLLNKVGAGNLVPEYYVIMREHNDNAEERSDKNIKQRFFLHRESKRVK